ncbi:hypothetical protein ACFL5P_03415 [candidate division KSB1 bacterium]
MLRKCILLVISVIICGTVLPAFVPRQQNPQEQEKDEYAEAVRQYYEYMEQKEFRKAYEMLSPIDVTMRSAAGGGIHFGPRFDYDEWYEIYKDIESLTITSIEKGHWFQKERFAENGDARAILGIREYTIKYNIQFSKSSIDLTVESGKETRILRLVKGTDDKIRILGIGTG